MDLSPDQTLLFRLWVTAAELACMGYSLYMICAVASIIILWKQRRGKRSLGHRVILPYTVAMLILSNVDFYLAIWAINDSMLSAISGTVAQILVACSVSNSVSAVFHQLPLWISDGLLVYRTYVILGKSKRWIAAPVLIYLSTIVLGSIAQFGCAKLPNGGLLLTQFDIKHIAIGAYTTTIGLNVFCTLAIITKLLPSTYMFSKNHPAARRAISVIGVLAESAALYTVTGLAFIVSLIMRSELEIVFGTLFGISAYLSSGFITLRIALGSAAVTGDTSRPFIGVENSTKAMSAPSNIFSTDKSTFSRVDNV